MKRGLMFGRLQRHFRKKRFQYIDKIIREILMTQETVKILDAGGRSDYWMMLEADVRSRTHITVMNFQSELEMYPENQGTLRIVEVVGDACNMPQYEDGSFDLSHSNSVIEHVGSYRNMQKFAHEMVRVGRNYYVQTPNFWFPVDPHLGVPFVHWLPDSVRMWMFTVFNVGYAKKCDFSKAIGNIDDTRMISRLMMRRFFPNAKVTAERVLFLAKSTIAIGKSN